MNKNKTEHIEQRREYVLQDNTLNKKTGAILNKNNDNNFRFSAY